MARMCSFENLSGRRKSYSLTLRPSMALEVVPPPLLEELAESSLPRLVSSASISHWERVLLIGVVALYRQAWGGLESRSDHFMWLEVPGFAYGLRACAAWLDLRDPGRGSLQPPAASRCSAALRAPFRGDPPL